MLNYENFLFFFFFVWNSNIDIFITALSSFLTPPPVFHSSS